MVISDMKSVRLGLAGVVVAGALAACGGGGEGPTTVAASAAQVELKAAATPGAKAAHVLIAQGPLAQRAGVLAAALGKPQRLLVGLGTVDVAPVQVQGLRPDIYDQYLDVIGSSSWVNWNSPAGAYVTLVAQHADQLGAIPMFTLYQMAANGDGVLTGLTNTRFMAQYWSNVRLMFQKLGAYGKPALVNLEPDFWGYTDRVNPDPTRMKAYVSLDSDCSTLPNTVAGVAACLVQTARKYAPNAYVGFPPSLFPDLAGHELAYMQKLGAGQADFVVMQTLDRDAGCFEAQYQPDDCVRGGSGWYWDENNQTSPNFSEHFALASSFHQGLALPLLWWQTPLGVPAAQPSQGSPWRDNRVHYFLNHASELVAAGGLGVVFSPGQSAQTTIQSDGGQFRSLSAAYLSKPAALP